MKNSAASRQASRQFCYRTTTSVFAHSHLHTNLSETRAGLKHSVGGKKRHVKKPANNTKCQQQHQIVNKKKKKRNVAAPQKHSQGREQGGERIIKHTRGPKRGEEGQKRRSNVVEVQVGRKKNKGKDARRKHGRFFFSWRSYTQQHKKECTQPTKNRKNACAVSKRKAANKQKQTTTRLFPSSLSPLLPFFPSSPLVLSSLPFLPFFPLFPPFFPSSPLPLFPPFFPFSLSLPFFPSFLALFPPFPSLPFLPSLSFPPFSSLPFLRSSLPSLLPF